MATVRNRFARSRLRFKHYYRRPRPAENTRRTPLRRLMGSSTDSHSRWSRARTPSSAWYWASLMSTPKAKSKWNRQDTSGQQRSLPLSRRPHNDQGLKCYPNRRSSRSCSSPCCLPPSCHRSARYVLPEQRVPNRRCSDGREFQLALYRMGHYPFEDIGAGPFHPGKRMHRVCPPPYLERASRHA